MSSWLDIVGTDQFVSTNGRLELKDENEPSSGAHYVLLDSQAILCIQGEDAVKFLQGQCTADVAALEVGQSTFGAICTNKGRVISNFRVLKTSDSLLLRMSSDVVKPTLESIEKYAAFFKAELSAWVAPSVAILNTDGTQPFDEKTIPNGVWSAAAGGGSIELYAEPSQAASDGANASTHVSAELYDFLGNRAAPASESTWYAKQIREGLTSINICTQESYLPHQLNLDRSGSVSFTKGCYTGQEIVARTEYRGKTKRRTLPVVLDTSIADFHETSIQANDESKQDVDLLMAAPNNGKTLAALLLPADTSNEGSFIINDEQVAYTRLPLPYELEKPEG